MTQSRIGWWAVREAGTAHHTFYIMGFFKKRSVNELGEKKKDMPEGLWTKCPSCAESLFEQALAKNLRVCSHCGYHFTISSPERITSLVDEGTFEEMDMQIDSVDALGFKGYVDKVKAYQTKTGLKEAVVTGRANIEGIPVLLAIMDFRSNSLGRVTLETPEEFAQWLVQGQQLDAERQLRKEALAAAKLIRVKKRPEIKLS